MSSPAPPEPPAGAGTSADDIEVVLPAKTGMVRLARLTASGVASVAKLPQDAVEDVRIAVDELCSWLIEAGDRSSLRLSFRPVDGALEVWGAARRGGTVDHARLELSRQILEAVVDEHSVDIADGDVAVWMRKSAGSSQPTP